jgi:23S rRNA (uracil1939-C5)-methyltransferase
MTAAREREGRNDTVAERPSERPASTSAVPPSRPSSPELLKTVIECKHATQCAGCPLIEHEYGQQLALKRAKVAAAAAYYPALEQVQTRAVEGADTITGYRTRAKLMVSPTGAIGLYNRSGHHEVVDIPGCRVLAPALADVAGALRALIASPPAGARPLLLPYDPVAGGVLRAVDLREVRLAKPREGAEDGNGVLVTLVLQRDRAPSREDLREAGRALRPLLPKVLGVAVNFHDAEAPQILGPETLVLDGLPQAEDRIGETYHIASFGSFVQAHRDQAARVHAAILGQIAQLKPAGGGPTKVLDLYGGSGAIALALAHAKCKVTMVESFPPATNNARAAAESQSLQNIEIRTGDVSEVLGQLAAAKVEFDAVVMNPPRRGVSPAAREAIARINAPTFVYVSCDPDTLARDLDHFARLGYATADLSPLDMIPLTEEVETITVLRKIPASPPRVLYEDQDVILVEKGPHEPLVQHPEYMSSLLARCTMLPRGQKPRPIHLVDPGTSGLCLLAKTEAARAVWTHALINSGRLIYLAAAKGVTPSKGAITRDLREGNRSYPARTRYRRLAVASGHSVLRVIPEGGRTHQIRRHLAAIGHPVLGDERYGHVPTNRYFEEKHGLDRSFVHLVRIEIAHPRTGQHMIMESTLPGDLRSALLRASGPSVLRFLEAKHALGEGRVYTPSPDDMPPPSRVSRSTEDSMDMPPVSRRMPPATVVDFLDEPPRTRRHPITSPDED